MNELDRLRRQAKQTNTANGIGSVPETFYFPLSATLYDAEYGDVNTVDNSVILAYEDEIRRKLSNYLGRDPQNMATYFNEDADAKSKLLSADWGFDFISGTLHGKVDVRLTESMTPEETEHLKDWICGQNSDGLGEGFEQQDIPTEEGILNLPWNSSPRWPTCPPSYLRGGPYEADIYLFAAQLIDPNFIK